jgi:acetoin utilization protein AcuC
MAHLPGRHRAAISRMTLRRLRRYRRGIVAGVRAHVDLGAIPAGATPLLVYGPRSVTYDFGPSHPLTPRRFPPALELMGGLGAAPSLAPEPCRDEELLACHDPEYVAAVRRFSANPMLAPERGIGTGDDPAFAGMHEASASVAGGSLRAMEAVLRGDATHAFHPGGGLHHAMRGRASGFCIYDDVALAIGRARREGLRVMYVDLDVHHGDGVEAIHRDDPGVLTVSVHETGRTLFPGTGFLEEIGDGAARGTTVNVPLEPFTGERGWLAAVGRVLPPLAEAFRPDVLVSQHGADTHAFDPLAHLLVTTTAMGAAARLVDRLAHEHAGGRWLATGGGGYDAYRVVPRSWSLVWLAQAHVPVPPGPAIPVAWRDRWTPDAERHGQAPLPTAFEDPPDAGRPYGDREARADAAAPRIAERALELVLPHLRAGRA